MTSKHPYSYMDISTINALLFCSICKKPFVDPVTSDDGRPGCRACFTSDYSPSQIASFTPIKEWIVIQMLNGLLVQCTRCGEKNIRRVDLEEHEHKACKSAIVPCNAADIKCPWEGAREQLNEHMNECIFEPLRPALGGIVLENQQLKERINRLEILINQSMEKKSAIGK